MHDGGETKKQSRRVPEWGLRYHWLLRSNTERYKYNNKMPVWHIVRMLTLEIIYKSRISRELAIDIFLGNNAIKYNGCFCRLKKKNSTAITLLIMIVFDSEYYQRFPYIILYNMLNVYIITL